MSELPLSLGLLCSIICFTWFVTFQLTCDSVVTAISAGPGTLNFKINRELLTKVRVDCSLVFVLSRRLATLLSQLSDATSEPEHRIPPSAVQ